MKAITSSIVALGLSLGAYASSQAATTSVSILPTETKTLLTVPKNRSAVVRSIVVSNPGVAAVCAQQILRGTAVKTDLCVPPGSSFQVEFSPALLYLHNESIELRNGDAASTTNFTVNYRIIPPGKGLYEKEKCARLPDKSLPANHRAAMRSAARCDERCPAPHRLA